MTASTYQTLVRVGFGGVIIVYLLQVFSPLRLNTDAINYLLMASSAADGNGFALYGGRTVLPVGYPLVLASLDRIGLGVSWVFVVVNLLFLGLGLAAYYHVLRRAFRFDARAATLACGLTLLCFTFVKHVTLPMAESMFFGVLGVCLVVLVEAEARKGIRRWRTIVLATGLVIVAISIRMAGIALIPALLWVAWRGASIRPVGGSGGRMRWFIGAVVLALGLVTLLWVAGQFLALPTYLGDLVDQYTMTNLVRRLRYNTLSKLKEWGELLGNVPVSRVPAPVRFLWPVLGLAGLGVLAGCLWRRRHEAGALEIFMLAYAVMLFVWPSQSARFWLPVIPLLMGFLAPFGQWVAATAAGRVALALYAAWFVFAGAAALTYSSWITFAGDAFPERYGDGSLQPTYRAAFQGGVADADDLHERALGILIRYEPRVHERWTAPAPVP